MQTNTAVKATTAATHDRTMLLASNVTAFKAWLIAGGYEVKDAIPAHAKQGIHYWVGVPPNTGKKGYTYLSVQDSCSRGARHVLTHVRLRPFIDEFLTAPLASAVKRAVRGKPTPAVIVVDQKAKKVAKSPQAIAVLQMPVKRPGHDAPAAASPTFQVLPLGVSSTPSANEQRANSPKSTAAPLTDFLRDLRDDFAVYCPLQERQFETAEEFAIRRWEYAQAMVNARPA